MKFYLAILISSLSTFSYGSALIAEAIKMRGEITQLSPGAKAARVVRVGDKFEEDTSILSGPKSFIKIKFIDNSEINLGPDSKIVISEMKSGEAGVISLLKGKIRTEVERKEASKENKFFIKTRTAAMGVRGTEFQTIYNPDNKLTSLLTFKGEVAMAKIDDTEYRKLEGVDSKVEIVRDAETHDIELDKAPLKSNDTQAELNKILSSKAVVTVPSGQNSMAGEGLKKATLPVTISPVQLNVLYKNEEYIEKDDKSLRGIESSDLKSLKMAITPVAQVAPKEGVFNEKTGDYAPRAGGLIDTKTGLYIAPDKNLNLNSKEEVLAQNSNGNLDRETGEFIAPAGLKLDAVKGFVLESASEDPKLLVKKEDMNKSISHEELVVDKNMTAKAYNLNEKFIRDEIHYALDFSEQELKINSNSSSANTINAKKDKFRTSFEWRIASAYRYRFFLGAGLSNVNFKSSLPSNYSTESRKLFNFYTGSTYAINEYLNLVGSIGLFQDHYLNQSSTTNNFSLIRIVTTKFSLGIQSQFFTNSTFPVDFDLYAKFNLKKRLNAVKVENGIGTGLKIGASYNLKNKNALWLGLWSERQKVDVNGEVSKNSLERLDSGLLMKYIVKY